jgi:hypothetical protein
MPGSYQLGSDSFLTAFATSDMYADVVKTVMILYLMAYLGQGAQPSLNQIALTSIVVVFYHSVVKPIFPGQAYAPVHTGHPA